MSSNLNFPEADEFAIYEYAQFIKQALPANGSIQICCFCSVPSLIYSYLVGERSEISLAERAEAVGAIPAQITPRPGDPGDRRGGSMNTTIFLADDHGIVREELWLLLETQPDLKVIGEAGNGREAVHKVVQNCPDIAIIDITMPELNGIASLPYRKVSFPRLGGQEVKRLKIGFHS